MRPNKRVLFFTTEDFERNMLPAKIRNTVLSPLFHKQYSRFLESCAVIGGTADPVLDECAGELENSCNSFVREDCTYKGEEKFNNTVTDAHACQELLQILGGVYGAEYFVYDSTTTDCIFYSTTASECDGYSGPTRPDIDDCAGEGTTAASTTTTTDAPTDATTDSPTDLS